ncbi:hypothetical protein [Brevundimonas subvibrioides]|uniref:Uncharacterized protein n=1 Tax=Brevundimonas subvibrioides (strain ATCC 15264 / DSM 4735 / LMG 14903 / NBRC 16000 / CB 81) TaxID=633149 RepID=D9QFW5_BRESC|nr:hypothetical protein [Brevundimonas subvibrioides]ADL00679.1 hypothetical protein Bresu_1367 [Brevundimonas subvibrioides ATCC 15264]
MSRALTDGEIKALFRQLVKACGGVEACGVELACKHQRVSLLQNINAPDMPSFRQILTLEAVAGSPIVTGAAARAIEGEEDETLSAAVVDAVQAAAEALGAVHAMEADGERTEAEIRNVQHVTQKALREIQEAADAAARLKPGKTGSRGAG